MQPTLKNLSSKRVNINSAYRNLYHPSQVTTTPMVGITTQTPLHTFCCLSHTFLTWQSVSTFAWPAEIVCFSKSDTVCTISKLTITAKEATHKLNYSAQLEINTLHTKLKHWDTSSQESFLIWRSFYESSRYIYHNICAKFNIGTQEIHFFMVGHTLLCTVQSG
jgi:hypothetical protein